METRTLEERPEIRPFRQNTLNPAALEDVDQLHFKTGWTVKYNTVQTSVSGNRGYDSGRRKD